MLLSAAADVGDVVSADAEDAFDRGDWDEGSAFGAPPPLDNHTAAAATTVTATTTTRPIPILRRLLLATLNAAKSGFLVASISNAATGARGRS
jgi:hypothetical protein